MDYAQIVIDKMLEAMVQYYKRTIPRGILIKIGSLSCNHQCNIRLVTEITELMGKLSFTNNLFMNPTLRRTNCIRTLAIEQNALI